MPAKRLAILVLVSAASGCGTGGGSVKPDDMSAAQHRDEAARENAAAREHSKSYDPKATVPTPFRPTAGAGSTEYVFSPSVYNPTEVQLQRADEHRAHARQHENAAEALERYEAAECFNFPPATRAACPLLGPVTRIDDTAAGVKVTFAPGTRVDAVYAHMRCHYAYARARAFEEAMSCPLYMRGIEIKRAADPLAIEINAASPEQVPELRARSRDEAVYARRSSR
ncbi:MAG TPA: hypothetical protein VN903_00305 [Polyangia bacterium]|nr:hypothetical protein [Polyangia bacterium]